MAWGMGMKSMQLAATASLAVLAGLSHAAPELTISGGASMSMGYIMESSDTSSLNYNGNRLQALGAQFLIRSRLTEKLVISTGAGITERHFPSGNIGNSGGRTYFVGSPYLVDADFKYTWLESERHNVSLTGGYFPYSYSPDVKNLGLYLIRGPVYPGILVSGFETKHTRPVANTLGVRFNHRWGSFEYNVILNSETETFPIFDVSPIFLASYRFGEALKIGAGVNFQHLLAVDPKLTSPDTMATDNSDAGINGDPNTRTYIYVDTVAKDTTFMSFAGTKVMANFSFDPKAFFGRGGNVLGPNDIKLYGEVAILGLNTTKAYNALYGDLKRRMPVMFGFNLPAFRLLDHLAVEVEWYGSRVKDDLSRFQASTGNFYSPIPVAYDTAKINVTKDDWKWSVHAERKFGQLRASAQVASDHARPGGTLTSPSSEWQTYFVKPTNWYWMLKLGFFF